MNDNPSIHPMDRAAIHPPSNTVDLAIQFAIQANQVTKNPAMPPWVIGPHRHPGLTLSPQQTIKDHCQHLPYAIPLSKEPSTHTESEVSGTGTSWLQGGSFVMALDNDKLPKSKYALLERQGEVEGRA